MATTTKNTTSIVRRLNTRLRTNPAYVQLFEAVDKVVRETVTEPRDRLATIRDTRRYHRGDWMTLPDGRRAVINHINVNEQGKVVYHTQIQGTSETFEITADDNLQDRGVLINNARYHGFNYFSDTLTTEDYARVADYIENFWPESGTNSYWKFLGFIKRVRLYQDVLWTTEPKEDEGDEYPFLEPNYGQLGPVWAGGDAYPTSHVQLRYDVLEFPDTNEQDLFNLFYLLAPIHLVLERIVWDIEAGSILLQTRAKGTISLYEAGVGDYTSLQNSGKASDRIIFSFGGLNVYESGRLDQSRHNVLPTMNVDLLLAHGIKFAVDMGEYATDIQEAKVIFTRDDGYVMGTFDSTTSRVYFPYEGGVGVYLEPYSIRGWPTNINYEIQVKRYYKYRTALTGKIRLIERVPEKPLVLSTYVGVQFALLLMDGATPINANDYYFYMQIVQDGRQLAVLSTANGRLYYGPSGSLAGYIPDDVFPTPLQGVWDKEIRYELYWRRKPTGTTYSAYSKVFEGKVVIIDPTEALPPI